MKIPHKLTCLTITAAAMSFGLVSAAPISGVYTIPFTNLPLWDVSGSYSQSNHFDEINGTISMDFTVNQDSAGRLTGSGNFHFQDDGYGDKMDGPIVVAGSVKTSGTAARVSLTLTASATGNIEGYPAVATAVFKSNFEIDPVMRQLIGTESGKLNATVPALKKSKSISLPAWSVMADLPVGTTGDWSVNLDLTPTGTKYAGNATLQTSTGTVLDLIATGSYSSKTDMSKISLKGNGASLSLSVSDSGTDLILHSLKGKALGQKIAPPTP